MSSRPRRERLNTERSLRNALTMLGIEPGMTLMVHSSLSAMGWVLGGAPTVVRALLQVIGEGGTLAMPAATPYCSEPEQWPGPKLPEAWLEEVRAQLPVFDPETTPTSLGAIPECLRTWPGTLRSNHPLESVCARGPLASEITGEHPLAFSEGPGGPFEKLYDRGSWVLLLGVGFNRCTALHFAETLVDRRRTVKNRFAALDEGRRVWIQAPNVADDNDTHFPIVGERFVSSGRAKTGTIGEGLTLLFPMRDLVDFATKYFQAVL